MSAPVTILAPAAAAPGKDSKQSTSDLRKALEELGVFETEQQEKQR